MELFLEVYGSFCCSLSETGKIPSAETVKEILYWFISDYTRDAFHDKLKDMLDAKEDFARHIIESADLDSPQYLYYFGEYITDSELQTWQHLKELPEETVALMADTYTEGYRIGFWLVIRIFPKRKP